MELSEFEKGVIDTLRKMKPRDNMDHRRVVIVDYQSSEPMLEIPFNDQGLVTTTAEMSEEYREKVHQVMENVMKRGEEIIHPMIIERDDREDGLFAEWIISIVDK